MNTTCEQAIAMNLLTVRDAAARFSVSRQTVLRWAGSGELKCLKIGNVLRFTPEAIEDFIRENEAKRTA